MAMLEIPVASVERLAAALVELGEALRELHGEPASDADERDSVERLWNRLGLDTQRFLYELAVDFQPGQGAFDLETVAGRLGLRRETVRARLMAIGRSRRAMGARAPVLWTSDRDPATRRRSYDWNLAAHETIMRLVEG
jgi:hypothetical protein